MRCPYCGKKITLGKNASREIYEATGTLVQIAEKFGVSRQTVWKIKTGRSHKHVNVNADEKHEIKAKPAKVVRTKDLRVNPLAKLMADRLRKIT